MWVFLLQIYFNIISLQSSFLLYLRNYLITCRNPNNRKAYILITGIIMITILVVEIEEPIFLNLRFHSSMSAYPNFWVALEFILFRRATSPNSPIMTAIYCQIFSNLLLMLAPSNLRIVINCREKLKSLFDIFLPLFHALVSLGLWRYRFLFSLFDTSHCKHE